MTLLLTRGDVAATSPANGARRGLPTIQGVVVLSDGEDGRPLALLDSMEITALRTGAATAVAARHLARADARVATVVGCGRQGRIQIAALARVRPLELVQAVDADPAVAARFAKEMSAQLGLEVRAAGSLAEVAPRSDIVVTCTPSRAPLLHRADVAPGTFVGAVGADNETKQELEPALMAVGTIVVDSLEQCATIGDLHNALAAGVVSLGQVHAELAQVVAGQRPGRRSAEEITIFDSSGVAIEDVAAAAAVYEKAVAAGRRLTVDLAS
jgi:ornithine cyclodeaminase/alanine dehydrogenase-like protein (mu-crystallin family)